ncbi:MAG: methyltransferase domain-containing protein [Pseudomonadales bacterium]
MPLQLDIEGLSHDGKGVARIAGKVCFVAGALPGEAVTAILRQARGRFDEYQLLRVREPAPERVEPLCPLVGRCGGCDLQHLQAQAQLSHKTTSVLELLERQAGMVPDALVEPLRSAPFGYRRRARLAVYVPRRGGRVTLGFREAGGSRIVPVAHCPVLAPPLDTLPGTLQAVLDRFQRPRDLGHVELSLSESSDGVSRALIYVRAVAAPEAADLARLESCAAELDAYLVLRAGDAPARWLHRPLPEAPAYDLPEFDLRIEYQPGDFLQGNAAVNRQLVSRVVEWLGGTPAQPGEGRVLDAFAGLGNFSLALARRGCPVLGLEAQVDMVQRARENATRNGLGNIEFQVRDLQDDPEPLRRETFAAALLDPPRTGARRLVSELAARAVPDVLYVSCWPPTLARDAALLAGAGYRLARLSGVDMFPQTSHTEVLAQFTLRGT